MRTWAIDFKRGRHQLLGGWASKWEMGTKETEREEEVVGSLGVVSVKEDERKEEYKCTTGVDYILKKQKMKKMEWRLGALSSDKEMPGPR